MIKALDLQKLIYKVRGKLEAENIDIKDYDRAINCLKNCVSPKVCIEIYENYINY